MFRVKRCSGTRDGQRGMVHKQRFCLGGLARFRLFFSSAEFAILCKLLCSEDVCRALQQIALMLPQFKSHSNLCTYSTIQSIWLELTIFLRTVKPKVLNLQTYEAVKSKQTLPHTMACKFLEFPNDVKYCPHHRMNSSIGNKGLHAVWHRASIHLDLEQNRSDPIQQQF